MDWQFDIVATGGVPLDDPDDQYFFSSDAALSYLVPDRWSGGVGGSYARAVQDDGTTIPGRLVGTGWATSISAFLEFYMEDHVSLSLSVNDSQQRQRIGGFNPSNEFFYLRSSGARIALTYRLAGGFNAPGLLTPTLGRSASP
jgi:hypothetical protein